MATHQAVAHVLLITRQPSFDTAQVDITRLTYIARLFVRLACKETTINSGHSTGWRRLTAADQADTAIALTCVYINFLITCSSSNDIRFVRSTAPLQLPQRIAVNHVLSGTKHSFRSAAEPLLRSGGRSWRNLWTSRLLTWPRVRWQTWRARL